MEYTIRFTKSSVEGGRTVIHETTSCEEDPTALKREVTKIAKELEPFNILQKECPIKWETNGYGTNLSYSKYWSPYSQAFPLEEEATYHISVGRSSEILEPISQQVYEAKRKVKEAYEALTNNTRAYQPDTSTVDPEIAQIVASGLPPHVLALIELIETVEGRIKNKMKELNEKTE